MEIHFRCGFVFTDSGRIARTNDPERSPGPLFALHGCASENRAAVRADIADSVAGALLSLAGSEPPLAGPEAELRHLAHYRNLLEQAGFAVTASRGLTYLLPHDLAHAHDIQLVTSESAEGKHLIARLASEGMPAGLAGMGFTDVGEFWAPWCAAMQERNVVAIAFAARLSKEGSALGLAAAPAFRGRGYASAATSGWVRMTELRSRALFYSSAEENAASRRVVARLKLRQLGASVSFEASAGADRSNILQSESREDRPSE